jgi:SAM-dependent methyltransferase
MRAPQNDRHVPKGEGTFVSASECVLCNASTFWVDDNGLPFCPRCKLAHTPEESREQTLDLRPSSRVRVKHPAPFSDKLLPVLEELLPVDAKVLDPFAGTGRIHELPQDTVGVELEPEWAALHPRTIVGNALALPFSDATFDAVATSPCYGNRFADHHKARDGSRRRSYTHDLGRDLHPDNAGAMHWGEAYRDFHRRAWQEVARVLKPEAVFVLNVSNHIRNGQEQPVWQWHLEAVCDLGFKLDTIVTVLTPRMRYGQNGYARVDGEKVMRFVRGVRGRAENGTRSPGSSPTLATRRGMFWQ